MRIRMMLRGLASFLLLGGVALAQGTTTTNPNTPSGAATTDENAPMTGQAGTSPSTAGSSEGTVSKAQMPYEATKSVSVLNAALIDANNNATMLRDLSKNDQSYDATHGRIFVENISKAIQQAETQVRHLTTLTANTREASKVQQIQSHVSQARGLVPTLQSSMSDPAAMNHNASQIAELTKNSISPLKDVAKGLNAKISVRSAG